MADESQTKATIGFVGIGQMGYPMALNVLEAGFDVIATDINEETLNSFETDGGRTAGSPATVATMADAVHVMVVDDSQVEEVVAGDDGLFEGFEDAGGKGAVFIHSTVSPGTATKLRDAAPAGISVLDAAVSGGGERAESGELTLMVGGDENVMAAYGPVLEAMGRRTHHLGPVGSGLATKLANNLIFHAAEAATMEALELGGSFGVPEEKLLEVFSESSGQTFFGDNYDYYTGDYLETHPAGLDGPARNARKNLYQALDLAKEQDVDVPTTGLVSQLVPRIWKQLAAERRDE